MDRIDDIPDSDLDEADVDGADSDGADSDGAELVDSLADPLADESL
ncbi:MAG: hypothetical protein HC802_21605 [Caldilineaceae bacterium]|nr:hypothetical protein [Caldilineaceae bacterium]